MNTNLFTRLLSYYHLSESDYQTLTAPVTESNFALGHHFDHIQEVIAMIHEVMNAKGQIFIYGDYDADGVMGTSILVKMFQYVDYPVTYYLPNRYEDGYGLTLKKAQEAVEKHISLVITVDNGVTAFEPISYLREHGVLVLVIDHHERQETLPLANYIIHPILSHFGDTPSSGAFTAFMFSIEFLGRFDKYLSILASISLISDMMPLVEYNRNLLRLVINNYQDGEFFQIDSLKENDPFSETSIGMKIAPKINAIGRLIDGNDINRLVTFFTEDDQKNLLNYISWIYEVNEERKNLSKNATESLQDASFDEPAIIIVCEVKEGILGLIANQLANKYHVPTLVLAKDKSGQYYKGSCRAPEGFSVVDAFQKCSSYIVNAGGHAMAGGCTIEISQFPAFKKAFMEVVKNTPIVPPIKENIPLGITEINEDNYYLVQTFSPFGETWPSPLFSLKRISVSSLFYSRDGKHLLTQIGQNARLTGFNISRDSLANFKYVDFLGHLRINEYKGQKNVEFLISEISESYQQ